MQNTHYLKRATLVAGIACATALVANSVAYAEPATGRGHHGGDHFPIDIAQMEARAAERFAEVDGDGDGLISASEFEQAAPRGFRHKPGKRGRHGRGRMHRGGDERSASRAAVKAEMFALLDTDGNGNISQTEYEVADRQTRRTAMQRVMFKRLDADGDGSLTQGELPNRAARLRAADADGDGLVTREEMKAARDERASARAAETS